MLNSNKQNIENGNNNMQANGDIIFNKNINYFGDYHPDQIVFYEEDICSVIKEFDKYTDFFEEENSALKGKEFEMILKPEKNELNNLSSEYFETICEDFLPYFQKVDSFLTLPQNKEILKKYRKIAFQLKYHITVIRKNYCYFEEVLNYIINEIYRQIETEGIGMDINILIVFINFMYWNCDIGRRHDCD